MLRLACALLVLAAVATPALSAASDFMRWQAFLARVAAVAGKDTCVMRQDGVGKTLENSYVFARTKTGFTFSPCQSATSACRTQCVQAERCTSPGARSTCLKARRCTVEDDPSQCVTIVPCEGSSVAPVFNLTEVLAFPEKTVDVFGVGITAPVKQAEFATSLVQSIAKDGEMNPCKFSLALQPGTNIVVAIAQFETSADRDRVRTATRLRRIRACIGEICYIAVQMGPQCRSDILINTDAGKSTGTAVWEPLRAKDNSGEVVPLLGTHTPGTSFPIGETLITYVAMDSAKNGVSCSFRIRVSDREAPVATCPSSFTVNTTTGQNTATPVWTPPTFGDNSGLGVSVQASRQPNSTFQIGTTTVTYTGMDLFGNVFSCSFNVTVQDKEAPLIVCPPSISTINDPDKAFGTVSWAPATAIDNSSPATISSPYIPPFAFPVDTTTTVSYTAKDIYGNQASCSFDVTVDRFFIEVSGQVLGARSARSIPNVSVSVATTRVPPPPPLTTISTTTRRTTTTTRRTSTTTRRTSTTTRRRPTRGRREDEYAEQMRSGPAAPGLQIVDIDGQPIRRRSVMESEDLVSMARREAQIVADGDGRFTVTLEVKTGTFTFQVSVNGSLSRTDISINAKSEWDKFMAARNQTQLSRVRRATTTAGVVLAVPEILFPDEWQVVLVWNRNTLATHNDFNSYVVTPYTTCPIVDPVSTALCDDAVTGRTTELLTTNYRNNLNGAGPETISFYGTQTGIYKHFVYGAAPLASYIDSQVQVNVYNINGLIATWHVTADGATSLATNTKHRFWHTFTLNLATLQLVKVNKITCSPALTTGNLNVIPGEGSNARFC